MIAVPTKLNVVSELVDVKMLGNAARSTATMPQAA
jgi:hypothetical protein